MQLVGESLKALLERAIAEDQAKVSVKGGFHKSLAFQAICKGAKECREPVGVEGYCPKHELERFPTYRELKDKLDKSEAWVKELGKRNSERIDELEAENKRLNNQRDAEQDKILQLEDKAASLAKKNQLQQQEILEQQEVKDFTVKGLRGEIQELKVKLCQSKVNLDNANAEISRLQAARANECFSAPWEDESSELRLKDETISELCERIDELEAETKGLQGKLEAYEAVKDAEGLRNVIQAQKATIKYLHEQLGQTLGTSK